MKSQEFRINEYITLKLKGIKTNIYVGGEFFRQCFSLLFQIPISDDIRYSEIHSIDDITESAQELGIKTSEGSSRIPPEEEFWGHCSNLQAWVDNDYNTRLISHNLAFPLLKRLTELGDEKAKKKYKEEITIRFIKGNEITREFLLNENYLKELSLPELEIIFKNIDEKFFRSETVLSTQNGLRLLNRLQNLNNEKIKLRVNEALLEEFLKENLNGKISFLNEFEL
jgi:hypothetical protein